MMMLYSLMIWTLVCCYTVWSQNCHSDFKINIYSSRKCLNIELESPDNSMELKDTDKISFESCALNQVLSYHISNISLSKDCVGQRNTQLNCKSASLPGVNIQLNSLMQRMCNISQNKMNCIDNNGGNEHNMLELSNILLQNIAGCNTIFVHYKYKCCEKQLIKPTESAPKENGLSDAGKIGLAISMGLLAAILIMVIAYCFSRRKRATSSDTNNYEKPTPVNTLSSHDNYGLPDYVHYVPYDALSPRQPTPGADYAEIRTSQMYDTDSKDVTDLYAKPNKVKAESKTEQIDSDLYEKGGPPNGHDNSYIEINEEDQTEVNRQKSIQRMVDNDIYNKE